jgi:DNA-directed RNA polymerase specialized sigma24 family protein
MTYTAAATRLGLPIGTVRSRLARARARAASHDPGACAPEEGRVA